MVREYDFCRYQWCNFHWASDSVVHSFQRTKQKITLDPSISRGFFFFSKLPPLDPHIKNSLLNVALSNRQGYYDLTQ